MLRKAGGTSVLAVHIASTPWSLLWPAFVRSRIPQTVQFVVLTRPKCKVHLRHNQLSASLPHSNSSACCVPAQYHDVQKNKDAAFCRCSVSLLGSWFSIFCIAFGLFFFLKCYFNVKFWRKWLAKNTATLKISLDRRMHELTYPVDWGSF